MNPFPPRLATQMTAASSFYRFAGADGYYPSAMTLDPTLDRVLVLTAFGSPRRDYSTPLAVVIRDALRLHPSLKHAALDSVARLCQAADRKNGLAVVGGLGSDVHTPCAVVLFRNIRDPLGRHLLVPLEVLPLSQTGVEYRWRTPACLARLHEELEIDRGTRRLTTTIHEIWCRESEPLVCIDRNTGEVF